MQAGFQIKADYPFIKVSLQTLWEYQPVHDRLSLCGFASFILTSPFLRDFLCSVCSSYPAPKDARRQELHNTQQISQVLAGDLTLRVRRGLYIPPVTGCSGGHGSLHLLELLPRLVQLWGHGGRRTPRNCRHPQSMRSANDTQTRATH